MPDSGAGPDQAVRFVMARQVLVPGTPAAIRDPDVIDLTLLLQVLRRRSRLVLGTCASVLCAALVYLAVVPPHYTAQALVLVDPTVDHLLRDGQPGKPQSDLDPDLASQVEMLQSVRTALAVIERAELATAPEFFEDGPLTGPVAALFGQPAQASALTARWQAAAVARLQDVVHVRRKPGTHLLAIEARARDPELAARIANTLVEVHLEERQRMRQAGLVQAQAAVQDQFVQAQHDLAAANRAMALFAAAEADGPHLSPDQASVLFGLRQQVQAAQAQHQQLVARLAMLRSQAAGQVIDLHVLSPALVPIFAATPQPKLVLTLALLGGLTLGIGLAVIRDYYHGGVADQDQLARILRHPVASDLPFVPAMASVADAVVTNSLGPYAEALRRVKASLDNDFRKRCFGPRAVVVLVTSARPAEGKTTLALGLARLYAQAGVKTVLIDGDLRCPSVHLKVGLSPSNGLRQHLAAPDAQSIVGSFYAADPLSRLRLVLGGAPSEQATDALVQGATFHAMLRQARQDFEVIVLDSAPALSVVDPRYMARHADAVVFCVGHGQTSAADLAAVQQDLDRDMQAGAAFLPVVNRCQIAPQRIWGTAARLSPRTSARVAA